MRRSVRPGKRVLFFDGVGTWKGVGTAWYLAEKERALIRGLQITARNHDLAIHDDGVHVLCVTVIHQGRDAYLRATLGVDPLEQGLDNGRGDPSMYKLALSTSLVCPQTDEAVWEIPIGGLLREVGSQHPSAPALVEVESKETRGGGVSATRRRGQTRAPPEGRPCCCG